VSDNAFALVIQLSFDCRNLFQCNQVHTITRSWAAAALSTIIDWKLIEFELIEMHSAGGWDKHESTAQHSAEQHTWDKKTQKNRASTISRIVMMMAEQKAKYETVQTDIGSVMRGDLTWLSDELNDWWVEWLMSWTFDQSCWEAADATTNGWRGQKIINWFMWHTEQHQ
jgi:hypothetical protein